MSVSETSNFYSMIADEIINLDINLSVAKKLPCPICFEEMLGAEHREPVSTPCGHIFCKSCIKTALGTSYSRCPVCQKTVILPTLRRLYI